ncbi:fatty acid CoA ligase family protein [Oligoflexia bacterium]|nr:fatty acid CoA ligase family protein [Oligoflexia bacterium]
MTSETYAHKLIPYPSHFATVSGFKMHYLDEGAGSVVLLLHGNPTWCFYYRNLIAKLKTHFRVIVPDYLGCGLSDHPPHVHFRSTDRIEHLQEFLDQLKLKQFSLVMHDWGGPIGTGLAVRDVDKIEKLVYLNTTLTETEALPGIIKMAAAPVIGKLLTKYSKRFLKITTKLGVCKKLSKEVCKGYYFPYRTAARRTAIWDFVDDIPFDSTHPSYAEMLNLAEQLPTLGEKPVQIIWGLKDRCFHREMLNKVASHFPNANILEIPQASHLVLEDAPELVGNTIDDFLLGRVKEVEARPEGVVSSGSVNALCSAFSKVAPELSTKPAVVEPLFLPDSVRYRHTTFGELTDLINQYQRGLTELGLKVGDKVLMLAPAGVEFLALSYAVMGRGGIPIFIDPGIGRKNLFQCISDVNPDVLIGSPRAQLLRLKRKQLLPELKFHVTASDWVYTGGPTLSFLKRFSSKPLPVVPNDGTAFIAFTSGATGLPKGVVFTNEMIQAQLNIFAQTFGLEKGKKDLPLLPIFSLYNLASGICSVFPPMDPARPLSIAPDRVIKIISDLQIDYSFGSPTLWNKIGEYCVRSRTTLSSVQKILMAGAPVPPAVLARVKEVIGDGEVYTPYGATEALPVTFISSEEILAHTTFEAVGGEIGTFVGRPVSGLVVRVVQSVEGVIDDAQALVDLEPGQIGEVIVQGQNVSPLYFERPEATLQAKIADGARFWHRMGDMGYLDPEGNLYFCGRKAHIVQSQERPFYSVPVERIFNEHKMVKRSALIALGAGREPGVAIEAHPQFRPETKEQRAIFKEELKALAKTDPLTATISEFFFHPSFPVDSRHNAKIYRDQLSEWASKIRG